MTLPNFLIIGAGRTGTTSLYNYLKQHPQIYMSPVKEPRFFAYENEHPVFNGPVGGVTLKEYSTNLQAYESLFSDVAGETAIGEASVDYFYIPESAERIKRHIPDAKLILILRQPVERAYSQFWARVAIGIEPLTDFSEAMRAEEERIQNNWPPQYHYKSKSFYSSALKRFYQTFDRHQIRVYMHEEYNKNPLAVLQDIFEFLEVDNTFEPDLSRRYNLPRGIAKMGSFRTILKKSGFVKTAFKAFLPEKTQDYLRTTLAPKSFAPRPSLEPETRKEFTQGYVKDILELQDLLGKDLSTWLK